MLRTELPGHGYRIRSWLPSIACPYQSPWRAIVPPRHCTKHLDRTVDRVQGLAMYPRVHACEARSTVHEARSTDGAPPLWRRVQRRTAEHQLFEVGATQCVRGVCASSYVRPCCSVFRVLPSNLRSTFELSVHPSRRRPGCSRGTTSPLCISSRGTFLHFGRGLPHALDVPVECPMPMATPTVLGPGHATSQTLSPTSPYHCRP